jgi:surface polysaccharide O-acyltransferase-like enzyme
MIQNQNIYNNQKKQRIAFFDVARSLCMLWIVSCWHLFDTIRGIPKVPRGLESLTIASLATFVFISGHFMGQRKDEDALTFYKLRLRRFYFLFAFSCVTLWLVSHFGTFHFINSKQVIYSLLGICCFVSSLPFTLWFFSMIICFYAVTPIFNSSKISNKIKISVCIIIYLVLFLSTNYLHMDNRILLYFPVYILGLFLKDFSKDFSKDYHWILLYCLNFCFGFCLFFKYRNNYLVNSIIALGAPFFVLSVCYFISQKMSFLNEIFHKIGYASMCMYLYHRQVFHYMEWIQNYLNPIFTYIVLMLSLFILGYSIQYLYDYIVKRITSRKV